MGNVSIHLYAPFFDHPENSIADVLQASATQGNAIAVLNEVVHPTVVALSHEGLADAMAALQTCVKGASSQWLVIACTVI